MLCLCRRKNFEVTSNHRHFVLRSSFANCRIRSAQMVATLVLGFLSRSQERWSLSYWSHVGIYIFTREDHRGFQAHVSGLNTRGHDIGTPASMARLAIILLCFFPMLLMTITHRAMLGPHDELSILSWLRTPGHTAAIFSIYSGHAKVWTVSLSGMGCGAYAIENWGPEWTWQFCDASGSTLPFSSVCLQLI